MLHYLPLPPPALMIFMSTNCLQLKPNRNEKKKNLLIKTKKRKKNAEQQLSQSGRTKTEMREEAANTF